MAYDFSALDFDTLKADLISYIKEDATFVDYNFDGSALNSIANLLTYITLQQNFYLNMCVQELYLDTATLYRNAVAIAKSLNYIPHRSTASFLITDIAIPEYTGAGTVEIPLHALFKVNGIPFTTKTSYNISSSNAITIELYQMEIKTETFVYDSSSISLIYGDSVDDTYITVKVNGSLWTEYNSTMNIGATDEVYFLGMNYNEKLEINFGDSVFGKKPTNGDTIEVIYGTTLGKEGNNLNDVTLEQVITDGIENYTDTNVVFSNTSLSVNGSARETIESIKLNAPKFYEAQNRAVTKTDYQALLEQLPYVDIVNVWSGVDNEPAIYGTVFITTKPANNQLNLTPLQKSSLLDYIKQYSPLSIRIELRDANYIYINVNSTVYYYKKYGVSTSTIRSTIENKINEYFEDNLTSFDSKLKYSNLVKKIDEPNEVSNNLTNLVYFTKFNQSPNGYYNFFLRNKIKEGSIVNEYVYDLAGKIYYVDTNEEIGTINYTTGEVEFEFDTENTQVLIDEKTEAITTDSFEILSSDPETVAVSGLSEGEGIKLQIEINGVFEDVYLNGSVVQLTSTNNILHLDLDGIYRLVKAVTFGKVSLIKSTSLIYGSEFIFELQENDAYFLKGNLPILNSTTIIFEGL